MALNGDKPLTVLAEQFRVHPTQIAGCSTRRRDRTGSWTDRRQARCTATTGLDGVPPHRQNPRGATEERRHPVQTSVAASERIVTSHSSLSGNVDSHCYHRLDSSQPYPAQEKRPDCTKHSPSPTKIECHAMSYLGVNLLIFAFSNYKVLPIFTYATGENLDSFVPPT